MSFGMNRQSQSSQSQSGNYAYDLLRNQYMPQVHAGLQAGSLAGDLLGFGTYTPQTYTPPTVPEPVVQQPRNNAPSIGERRLTEQQRQANARRGGFGELIYGR